MDLNRLGRIRSIFCVAANDTDISLAKWNYSSLQHVDGIGTYSRNVLIALYHDHAVNAEIPQVGMGLI